MPPKMHDGQVTDHRLDIRELESGELLLPELVDAHFARGGLPEVSDPDGRTVIKGTMVDADGNAVEVLIPLGSEAVIALRQRL